MAGTGRASVLAGEMMAGMGGKRIEKWGQPLRVIALDYIEVTKDAYQDAKKRPLKTLVYLLLGGGLVATWKSRPSEADYRDCLLGYSNELFQCSPIVRNPHIHTYVANIVKKSSNNQLAYKNFGFFSLIMEREHNSVCKSYHVTCKHVRERWWNRWKRVVDFGLWGRWWALDRELVDYDVNEEELEKWLEEQKLL